MYLGITRVGSLSVADAEAEQPSSSGRPVDDRVDSLISRIRPARHSEQRRHRVAHYVSGLITKCFSANHEVEAFMFGSVPLKTYLPDGDIDMSVFQSKGNSLRDTWTTKLCAVLEDEQRDPYAQFRVRDVQVIHAEVKLLKCLVDNIVVDISFETLGGLCTVAFLESIDRHVQGQHLFKRSVILVKAWCYYESRLLGAPHGLISTYALETMVLYIFNVHHQDLKTPCQVLHKFLEVFSHFDWDKYCLSLQGPILLSSFPHPKVEIPPDLDQDKLLLDEDFTDEMMEMYSPVRQKQNTNVKVAVPNSSRNFPVKFLNIMDPLLPTNNLGRSVNKASFARIRKALAHGAKTLSNIMTKDDKEAVAAIDKFFKNAWKAQRPVAKASQQGSVQQGSQNWPGNKTLHGYGPPLLNIPPEQLQYWQQYQQQRVLQHMQQQQQYQQQVQQAARHQHLTDHHHPPGSSPSSARGSAHPPAFPPYLMLPHHLQQLQHQQQQQQQASRQRTATQAAANGHVEPPARVASPFATHARASSTENAAPHEPDANGQTPSAATAAAADTAADDHDSQPAHDHADAQSNKPAEPQVTSAQAEKQSSTDDIPSDSSLPPSAEPTQTQQHDLSSMQDQASQPALQEATGSSRSQAVDLPLASSGAELTQAQSRNPGAVSEPAASGPAADAATNAAADAATVSQESQQPPAAPVSTPASEPVLQNGTAAHLQQLASSAMMAQLQHGLPGYGSPMSSSARDVYGYSGMQIPMLPPGMMMPPPPQPQHQHQSRPGRGSRAQSPVSGAAGQYQAQLEQLFPDMRPPMIPQHAYQQQLQEAQLAQHSQQQHQQQQQQQSGPVAQQSDDILAGDIEQLNDHLQTARLCHTQKPVPMENSTHGNPNQAASDQIAAPSANGVHANPSAGFQAGAGQHRREDSNGPALHAEPRRVDANSPALHAEHRRADANGPALAADRRRPKERHDRWPGANGMYPTGRLAQSNSPPINPAYPPNHPAPIPPHLLQQQFAGQVLLPPPREYRHPQQQQPQHQQQGYWMPQHHHHQQQHIAMPPWQPQQVDRSPSADDLHRRSLTASSALPSSDTHSSMSSVLTHPPPPVSATLPPSRSHEHLSDITGHAADARLAAEACSSYMGSAQGSGRGPAGVNLRLPPGSALHGPASVDSPPAPRGIWGDGLHQQRLTNLANDLASVKVAPPGIRTAAAEAPAAVNYAGPRKESLAPSSSRSAGSTPHAAEAYRPKGGFPFDSTAALKQQRRQRFPHNASAQELGQTGTSSVAPEAPPRNDRAGKLSLDSLTSQAEAAKRQQALAGFELNTDDFPALGGFAPSMVATASPARANSRTPAGKAWSETDALSPPLHKSPPE